jgi:glucuronate isomerase
MNNATLDAFRKIADVMIGTADWQWVGPHMSQRMFGITRERAEAYAAAHGGRAEQMPKAVRS